MGKELTTAEINEALLHFAKGITKALIIMDGICTDIDLKKYTCTVTTIASGTDTGLPFYEVPLKVLIGSQASFIEIPADGTRCELGFRSRSLQRPQILMVHQVQTILVKVVDTDGSYIDNGVVFNDGNNGGLVIVKPLFDWVNEMNTKVNTILSTLKGITVPTATPYPFAPLFSSIQPVQAKAIDDITDKKIVH